MTGTGTPSSGRASDDGSDDADRRSRRRRSRVLVVLALTLSAVVASALLSDRTDPAPITDRALIESLDRDMAAAGAMSQHGERDLDARAVLLRLDDLGEQWAPAGGKIGDLNPSEGFCGRSVRIDDLERVEVAPFQATPAGPYVVSAVLVHGTVDAADAYLGRVQATASCGGWADPNGAHQEVRAATIDRPDADRSLGFVQISRLASTTFRADIVYVRQGPLLGLVAAIRAGTDDDPAVDGLVDLVARRLRDAAG